MNNRKQTSRGAREYKQRPIQKVIGFTVKAALIDENGKKTNNSFIKFIPVTEPKHNIKGKVSSEELKRLKRENWQDEINLAAQKAADLLLSNKFPCIILPKIVNTSIPVKVW